MGEIKYTVCCRRTIICILQPDDDEAIKRFTGDIAGRAFGLGRRRSGSDIRSRGGSVLAHDKSGKSKCSDAERGENHRDNDQDQTVMR